MDLSTAIRIFLTRSVQEQGIPFDMKLNTDGYKTDAAAKAMRTVSRMAKEYGLADMMLDEINAEISAAGKGD